MTTHLSSHLGSPKPPTNGPTRVHAWRWAAPAALLAVGGLYVALSTAQSEQPFLDQPIGWIARPVLSNNDLISGNEVVFRPDFNKSNGSGSLFAYKISASGTVQSTTPWTNADAGVLLKSQDPFTGRRIFTVNNTSGAAVPFVWGSLSAPQKAALGDATNGPKVLSFLRGATTDEGTAAGQFRIRPTPLGSIVHSTVLYWNHGTAGKRLYVGANDGMLHAFDATSGKELFAYVPSMLVPRLAALAQPGYKSQAYVNGPLNIANINDSGTTRTMLVGGLGNGGMGLFGLDVSASSFTSDTAAANTLKWEISPTTTGFGNLGYTYALPRLGRHENGKAAVVVGNGYRSDSGKATLLVINALTGALINEIDTGVGSTTDRNGLSSPTLLDADGNGKVDTAYAGDLQGNLWKFDLKKNTKTKLLTTSPAQAITTAPALRPHPLGGQLVIVGTGKALIESDLSDQSVHAVYGVWDDAPSTNTALLEQTVTEVTVASKRWRSVSSNAINWDNSTQTRHKGWKLILPAGERVLGEPPYITDNRFVFASMNPTTASTSTTGPGENWMTQVSVFNGGNFANSIFDVNNDGAVNELDKSDAKVLNGRYMADGVVSQPVLTDMTSLSRTLFNYNPEITVTPATVTETKVEYTPGGVSDGHFDVDVYYAGKNQEHDHEYDDKYNVVGVNFLAPSNTAYLLSKGIKNPNTPFKVLVVNQYLNAASWLRVGPGSGVTFKTVKEFQGQASATESTFVDKLDIYQPRDIGNFVWKLPVDAFSTQDWWGDGVKRAGLMPTQTGCVNKGFNKTPGKDGEIYNGALTLQLIKPDTPATALELNYPAGGPKYGWRVKADSRADYVLAEYTMFWHHPNKLCYGQNGWVPDPPQDPSVGKSEQPAAGANDPDGTFDPDVDGPLVLVRTDPPVTNGNTTTITEYYSDGSKKIITKTVGEDSEEEFTFRNGEEVTDPTKLCIGGVNPSTGQPCEEKCLDGKKPPCGGPPEPPFQDGRFSWRELRSSN